MTYVGAEPGSVLVQDYEDADGTLVKKKRDFIRSYADEHKRLTRMVDELDGQLASVKREQDILSVRERVHRNSR